MRHLNSLFILLILFLLSLTSNPATASFISEAAEIPYQINHSDRIAIGTVSEIDMHHDYMIATIKVNEWLYNSLPIKTIKVRSEIGTNSAISTEAEFIRNESMLLMLKDENLGEQLFRVAIGEPGKHPVSDREEVIEGLKAQGKWQKENLTVDNTASTEETEITETTDNQEKNQTVSKENDTGTTEKTETAEGKKGNYSSTKELNNVSFISLTWVLALLLSAVMYLRK